jgi:hypothetical protein
MTADEQDHVNRYTSGQVCAAVGITQDTLKNWVSRKPQVIFLTKGERDAVEAGGGLLFSFQRALQIALTAKIVKTGMKPRDAAIVAGSFTDIGEGPLGDTPGRNPCKLFNDGLTVLAWYPDEALGRVMNLHPTTRAHDLFWFDGAREEVGAVIVNHLHARLRAALGLA